MKNIIYSEGVIYLEVIFVILSIVFLLTVIMSQSKYMVNSRNTRRKADVMTISTAIYGYNIDNKTKIDVIGRESKEVCQTDYENCQDMINLQMLTSDQPYLQNMPIDPLGSKQSGGTGYFVNYSEDGRIRVTAPYAEDGENISISR